jgi:hypothetical protein
MEIFNKRQGKFDVEYYKGKNYDVVKDCKIDIANCTSKKLADFKFKKLQ